MFSDDRFTEQQSTSPVFCSHTVEIVNTVLEEASTRTHFEPVLIEAASFGNVEVAE